MIILPVGQSVKGGFEFVVAGAIELEMFRMVEGAFLFLEGWCDYAPV